MKTYRIGIVGAGMIATVHADAVRALAGAELAGVMDGGNGRGKVIAPECDTHGSADLATFAARDDIDVLMIASPTGAHLEAGELAAANGKHCLVEKPMEVTCERIDRLIDAHARAGTALGGIFNTRYTEGARLLKSAVEAGRFGRLAYAAAVGPWWREQSYYDDSSWKGTWTLDGGGALMNQGIHSIDLLQWLVGVPVTSVSGRIATLAHERVEVEDTGVASIAFAGGALGTIACTTSLWPGHFRTITLGGSDGTAVLADGNLLMWQFRDETPDDAALRERLLRLPGAGVGASDPAAGVTHHGHLAALTEFLEAVRAGRPPGVDGHEARKSVAIIRAIYASAAAGGASVTPAPA